MSYPSSDVDQHSRWRQQAVVGDISDDFLTVNPNNGPALGSDHLGESETDDAAIELTPEEQERRRQIRNDEATARALQESSMPITYTPGLIQGRLSVTVAQAKLAKNYGLMKMDPYCRIRVGHSIIEVPTCSNGSKNPRWNKVVHAYLPSGVDSFHLEIYDEKLFAMDDKIAWAHITIPPAVMDGQTVDDWFPLTGKQGDDKEGMINLILTFSKDHMPPPNTVQPGLVMYNAPMYYPPPAGLPVYPQAPVPTGPLYTEEDVAGIQEMFPNVDEEVVRSVLDSHRGNKNACISALLQMNADN